MCTALSFLVASKSGCAAGKLSHYRNRSRLDHARKKKLQSRGINTTLARILQSA